MDELELDFDRFIYEESKTFGGDIQYYKVGCYHKNTEPIRNILTNHQVATLCLDCDTQLPVTKGDHSW